MAEALAAEVIKELAFEPISDTVYAHAMAVLSSCENVICCLKEFGTINERNRQLAALGKEKLIDISAL